MTETTKKCVAVATLLVGVVLWQAGQQRDTVQPVSAAMPSMGMPQMTQMPADMPQMTQTPVDMPQMAQMQAGMAQMQFPSGGGMQAPPMDMSGLMANQVMLQGLGDQMAMQEGAAYLNSVQDYRRRTGDYTTPFNVVSQDSLRRSIQGANDATQAFIGSGAASSAARAQAADVYSTRGVLGLNEVWNPATGTVQSVDGNMQRYYADRYGVAHGTPGTSIPYGTTPLVPRWQ